MLPNRRNKCTGTGRVARAGLSPLFWWRWQSSVEALQGRSLRMPRVLSRVRTCSSDDGPATTPATTGRRPELRLGSGRPLLSAALPNWRDTPKESAESQAQGYHYCPVVAHVAGRRGRGGASRDWCQCRPCARPGRRRQPPRLINHDNQAAPSVPTTTRRRRHGLLPTHVDEAWLYNTILGETDVEEPDRYQACTTPAQGGGSPRCSHSRAWTGVATCLN